jgi:hypothetical protein
MLSSRSHKNCIAAVAVSSAIRALVSSASHAPISQSLSFGFQSAASASSAIIFVSATSASLDSTFSPPLLVVKLFLQLHLLKINKRESSLVTKQQEHRRRVLPTSTQFSHRKHSNPWTQTFKQTKKIWSKQQPKKKIYQQQQIKTNMKATDEEERTKTKLETTKEEDQ